MQQENWTFNKTRSSTTCCYCKSGN